jgi:hypothetical protein
MTNESDNAPPQPAPSPAGAIESGLIEAGNMAVLVGGGLNPSMAARVAKQYTDKCAEVERLWCCHVRGPDDVHPAPDYETALTWSDWINDRFGPHTREDENYPIMRAAPAIWPWSAARHAAALPAAIAELTPRGPLPPPPPPMLAAEISRLRSALTVTEEMVERAAIAAYGTEYDPVTYPWSESMVKVAYRRWARAALTAALAAGGK